MKSSIIIGLLFFFLVTPCLQAAEAQVYDSGDTVKVGYMSYVVHDSWWSDELSSNEFMNQEPNAKYLFVSLTVRNEDNKPRTIPLFYLIDENGSEYQVSDHSPFAQNAIGLFDNLNPEVKKKGVLVFDVPENHTYKLKLSGGYWSGDSKLVRLKPVNKIDLSLKQRKAIWKEYISKTEEIKKAGTTEFPDAEKDKEEREALVRKLRKEEADNLIEKHQITNEQFGEILIEGLKNRWPIK